MSLFIIHSGCPNCGGEISDDRLKKGQPCFKCLPEDDQNICFQLKKFQTLDKFSFVCSTEEKLESFSQIFKLATGYEPSNLQKTWAKRLFLQNSFALVAPPGIGKTTFGLIASLVTPKALLLFPTKLLAQQAFENLQHFNLKTHGQKNILLYEAKKPHQQALKNGDFDILLGTNMFFHRQFPTLSLYKWPFIFIDDIDSFLKNPKNIDRLFLLLGFSKEEITSAKNKSKDHQEFKESEGIKEKKKETTLIISSATLKPKAKTVALFRRLCGFDLQMATSTVRNIVDCYKEVKDFDESLKVCAHLVKKLGQGGLIFVPLKYGKEIYIKICEYLKKEGLAIINYSEHPPNELYELMSKGAFDVAVGLAHLHNPLVRGIDLPLIIKYVIFLDVPKFIFPLDLQNSSPSLIFNLFIILSPLLSFEDKLKYSPLAKRFQKKFRNISLDNLEKNPRWKQSFLELKDFIEQKLKERNFIEKIEASDDVSLEIIDGEYYLTVADVATYIQASGRTSRLTTAGLTKGLSIILYWDKKAIANLKKRLRYYFHTLDIEFKDLDQIEIEKIIKEINEDRHKLKLIREHKLEPQKAQVFKSTLIIVESPNKAKTIASFFGQPQIRRLNKCLFYEIPLADRILSLTASFGHILDLKSEPGFFGVLEENYLGIYDTIKKCKDKKLQHTEWEYLRRKCQESEILDMLEVVEDLRRVAYEVDDIFIATDPDAEGEKIAYDLYVLLAPFNHNIYRAEFHEITPKAFRESLAQPKAFNLNRVKAQMTRRIADRWVGFTLSRKLWEKYGQKTLSAGRVQTPVLGWVIRRAVEAKNRIDKVVIKTSEGNYLSFFLDHSHLASLMRRHPDKIKINFGPEQIIEKTPPPPYTTDTILQDLNRKLRISADKAMKILQELFEKGFITYHRTDSTRVSEAGKFQVAKAFLEANFKEDLFYPRSYSEEGAHEAIRPTRPLTSEDLKFMINIGSIEFEESLAIAVYDLIFKRFIASQMKSAQVIIKEIVISFDHFEYKQEVVTQLLKPGYTIIYPNLDIFKECSTIEKISFYKVPKTSPFTQGTLIHEMKEKGLGRPSTYAQIIQTLLERNYIVEKRGYLYPTSLGLKVFNFLNKNYNDFVNEEFTKKLEAEMDEIEENKKDYLETLKELSKIKNLMVEDRLRWAK